MVQSLDQWLRSVKMKANILTLTKIGAYQNERCALYYTAVPPGNHLRDGRLAFRVCARRFCSLAYLRENYTL